MINFINYLIWLVYDNIKHDYDIISNICSLECLFLIDQLRHSEVRCYLIFVIIHSKAVYTFIDSCLTPVLNKRNFCI